MTTGFSFGPTGGTAPAPTAQAGIGQPPAQPAQAAQSTAQLVAQMSQGAHDAGQRTPELPPGHQFRLKIQDFRLYPGEYGSIAFIDVSVMQASDGAGTGPGNEHTVKITGFGGKYSNAHAWSDLKNFINAVLAPEGLTSQWNGTDEQWAQIVNQLATACDQPWPTANGPSPNGPVKGREVFAQTSLWVPGKKSKDGAKNKIKVSFFKTA